MTLLEFTNMHLSDASGTEQPVYVFGDPEIFNYSYWGEMKKYACLLFTIASGWACSVYLKPEFANADVKYWGVIDGQSCVVIDTMFDIQASPQEEAALVQKKETTLDSITLKDGRTFSLLKCKEEADGTIYMFGEVVCKSSMEDMGKAFVELDRNLPYDLELMRFENGHLVRLATEKEVFGENIIGCEENAQQFDCMKKRKNRIAVDLEDCLCWWWLGTIKKGSSEAFAIVYYGGHASYNLASAVGWVRPLVKIRNYQGHGKEE